MGMSQMSNRKTDRQQVESEKAEPHVDPVIAAYMKSVDRTLLRENLKLSPTERFEKHEHAAELFDELRKAGERSRNRQRQSG